MTGGSPRRDHFSPVTTSGTLCSGGALVDVLLEPGAGDDSTGPAADPSVCARPVRTGGVPGRAQHTGVNACGEDEDMDDATRPAGPGEGDPGAETTGDGATGGTGDRTEQLVGDGAGGSETGAAAGGGERTEQVVRDGAGSVPDTADGADRSARATGGGDAPTVQATRPPEVGSGSSPRATGPYPAGPGPYGPGAGAYAQGPYSYGQGPAAYPTGAGPYPQASGPYPQGPGPYPPYGAPPGWAPPTETPRRRRRGLLLGLGALVTVLVLLVVAVVVFLLPPSPDDAVAAVAGDVRGWEGVTYRGTVEQPGVGPVDVEITTNAAGDRSGVLTRPEGGRAQYAVVGGVPLVNGDTSWWNPEAQGAGKAMRLAGFWVKVPAAETSWLDRVALPAPPALSDDLTAAGSPTPEYLEPGEQAVDGVEGRAIEWPGHRVVLSDERTPRLLAVVPPGSADPAGLRVTRAVPEALTAVGSGPDTLTTARGYEALLYAPTQVSSSFGPLPTCTTPTCSVTFTLRNTAVVEARGVATLLRDTTVVGRRPFTLAAGASGPVTITEPNPAYAQNRDFTATLRVRVTAN